MLKNKKIQQFHKTMQIMVNFDDVTKKIKQIK